MKIKGFISLFLLLLASHGCGVYSFSGAATTAKTISIEPIFNNTDLAPANIGATFTNKLKDYFQQNSSLRVTESNGELHIDGTVSEYRINAMAPVSTGNSQDPNTAALSRLTISVKLTFEDTLEPKNNFKDRTFSFYRDFDNTLNFPTIQEDLERRIFDQILIDIFNATVANW
ncbi:MAG: LptE family protein [Cyclobacteriaceae bacterium]|nr:LptE family protein [Cyclobacteriaceae bacterium]